MADIVKPSQVAIVMVPFPAQGHLNQLLHLSRLLTSYNLPIHYVASTTHVRQAKLRLHGWDVHSTSNIHFHEIQTPPVDSPPPNPTEPTSFPTHLHPLMNVTSHLREPVASLLHAMSADMRRVVVIHDSFMQSVVQDVATILNAESYTFESTSAFCIFRYILEFKQRPSHVDDEMENEVPSLQGSFSQEFLEFIFMQGQHKHSNSGFLYNTCRSIEDKYIDLVIKEENICGNMKGWAIGPFNPILVNQHHNQNQKKDGDFCLNWLDEQAKNSVLFVSFGTTSSFTDEQINEIAIGLELSNQKFIWVLRDADKVDVFDEDVRRANLPEGYEERIEGRGIVVRSWAPQLEILSHSATGGFMSHCGWNSCIESISCGVPIAAWPMHSDQPHNAVLVTKVLKTGVVVKDWARRNELVSALTVQTSVRRLMVEKEGNEIRKRAAELGSAVKRAVAKGGVSKIELDSFVAHITR